MRALPSPFRGAWLINDEGAETVATVWNTAQTTGQAERIALALEGRGGQPFDNDRRCAITDGVAVMEIDGPLIRKGELFSDVSGITSYQWIGATVDRLRLDPEVRAVILKINSPGGEAAGVGECAEKLARLAAAKHLEGYVETQAASAAAWLLVQCTHITAHATAQVGWIGAIKRMMDTSERDAKDGIRTIEWVSAGAERKRTTPLDDAVKARFQRTIDQWGALFTAAVAEARDVSAETVLADFGGGDGMFAEQALAVGLIDALGDFESTFAGLAGATPSSSRDMARASAQAGDIRMSTKQNPALAAAGASASADGEWQCSGCNEMMGKSAQAYCAKCADDDDDDDDDNDENEDEAKALGLSDVKASAAVRQARKVELSAFELSVFEATGTTSRGAALAVIASGMTAMGQLPSLQSDGRTRDLQALLEAGLRGEPGKQPTLSLGMIQRTMATALRGDQKKAWLTAMDKVSADADAADKAGDKANASVGAKQIIAAACSVAPLLSSDDMVALKDFVGASSPIAAANHVEPDRLGGKEAEELDAKCAEIDKLADKARRTLDRNK